MGLSPFERQKLGISLAATLYLIPRHRLEHWHMIDLTSSSGKLELLLNLLRFLTYRSN